MQLATSPQSPRHNAAARHGADAPRLQSVRREPQERLFDTLDDEAAPDYSDVLESARNLVRNLKMEG